MTSNCSEIKSWLEVCLKKEHIRDIKVHNLRYSEKGDGFIGDVIFAHVSGKKKNGLPTEYNLVLKCSKDSKVLRETSPNRSLFLNEIYFYETLLPAFIKFQFDQGIENPFSSVPKYYGSFIDDVREVLVLEDLTIKGYVLWDKKKPMTRKHIDLIVSQYAKFHAISVAMQDQFLEEYLALIKPLQRLLDAFDERENSMLASFTSAIEDVYQVLKEDLDVDILSVWRNFGKLMETSFVQMIKDYKGLRVVNHGDCWNNNFLFQIKGNDIEPVNVSLLDWQIAKTGSPISDLSHFLFASMSSDDLEDLDNILNEYYSCFSNYLTKLKSKPEIYSKKQFLQDWQQYSKFGITFISITMKVCIGDSEDLVDMGDAADQGDYTKTFRFEVKNKTLLKNRMIPVVKYVVKNKLI